jgi:hypothetical protein
MSSMLPGEAPSKCPARTPIPGNAYLHAIEQVPEPSTEAEHYMEISRAKSLATSAAAVMRELLDEVSTLITEFEGSWKDDPVEP